MRFFRDRFLAAVLVLTVVIVLGMFVLHKTVREPPSPDSGSRNTSSINSETRGQNLQGGLSLPSQGPFRIARVLDGDTLVLDNGETVRLIGVDAPEIHHPEIPVQRFGQESTEFLRRLAEGFECTLEYEPEELRDKYGRLLAYVFVGDRLVNAEMIRRGYAYAYTRFTFRRKAEFLALEREARQSQSGLWHLSLRDGRIANLVHRYESLNLEGRIKLDEFLEKLAEEYPYGEADLEKAAVGKQTK